MGNQLKIRVQLIYVLAAMGIALALILTFGVDLSSFSAGSPQERRVVVVATLLAGLVIVCVTVAQASIRTIRSLTNAVEEFTAGNLKHRIGSLRKDTLGDLARAFDRMGDKFEQMVLQVARGTAEREQAEGEAFEAKQFLEAALSQSPSGILIAQAPDCTLGFANEVALNLCSLKDSVLMNGGLKLRAQSLKMHYPDGSACPPEQHPLTRAVLHGETTHNMELIVRDRDGNDHWINANAAPLYDAQGRIIAGTLVLHDVTDRRRIMNRMQEIAYQDALTGLANRVSILDSMQQSIDRRDGNQYALLFMDFDRFKLINDSLGHDVGDELLREIGRRVRAVVRVSDEIILPARLGGDEFVIWLDNLSCVEDATVIAERLLNVLSQSYELRGQTVCSTASIGIVTSEHPYFSALDMLRDADLAMYKSKSDGKARYTVFDNGLREKVQLRLQFENEMREGILRDEFFLEFQPIVTLETGKIVGAEALARWAHPQRGTIDADQFIGVAEETGMIVPIGDRIINDACRLLALWHRSLGCDHQTQSIHVNVSRLQLLLPNLVSVVKRALHEHGIRPECLNLEVTESVIMDNPERVVARLHELRDMGVKVSIDDFGTGYSSLSCLHQFPIDYLKLDRSFTASVNDASGFAALLTAVLTLTDQLELRVVAEGIEDASQVVRLKELGCEYGQGYLFAKPMTSAEFISFVESQRVEADVTELQKCS